MARQTKTLSIKVTDALRARLLKLAKRRKSTVSAVVREAIERFASDEGAAFADTARQFIGSVDGGPGDLATNPRRLKRLGR